MNVAAVILGLAAFGCIALGSLIGAVAYTDGQTGMVVFPLFGLGAVLGCIALVMAFLGGSRAVKVAVISLALLAVATIPLSIWYGEAQISRSQESKERLNAPSEL